MWERNIFSFHNCVALTLHPSRGLFVPFVLGALSSSVVCEGETGGTLFPQPGMLIATVFGVVCRRLTICAPFSYFSLWLAFYRSLSFLPPGSGLCLYVQPAAGEQSL